MWHTLTNRELLRITVPNMTCHGIDFMRDGKSIISGKAGVPGLTSAFGCLWFLPVFSNQALREDELPWPPAVRLLVI